jgi:putative ABC transport system permease protein
LGIFDALRAGLTELFAHKMRSFLTMLGVIFGVAAVIAMVSISEGARYEALEQIRLMGVNVIHVRRQSLTGDALTAATKKSPTGLNYGDAQALRQICSFAQRMVPICRVFGQVEVTGEPLHSRIYGTIPGYEDVAHFHVHTGRFIDDVDVHRRARVCVLGTEVKRRLFRFEDPIGKSIEISNNNFRIIGVMEERVIPSGKAIVSLRDMNGDIYIPITVALEDFQIYSEQAIPLNTGAIIGLFRTMMDRPPLNQRSITEISLEVGGAEETVPAAAAVKRVLDRRHNDVNDYEIVIPAELIKQSQQAQGIFNIVMGAIASISLLVGGIGIMNIMLATVTQRTREIGIRRAIGARRSDIMQQFLIEAVIVTLLGGAIGVAIGVQGAKLVAVYAKWKTIVSLYAIILSFAVSVIVGILFGMYPALKAAQTDPITALRYE